MKNFYIVFKKLPYDYYTSIIKAKNKREALKIAINDWCDEHLEEIKQIDIIDWDKE